ncbi:F0F1 ATP synthase subunit gamma [Candidatus Daviesbacteria bacterium]|nr:F0F1 ATP synthase subunit gamma [Candidatus Daviesbacteria bacterium]
MTIRDYNKLIEEGVSLKQIAQAYGEIASLKIRKIRSEVERNRTFFNEISTVYKIVKQQAAAKKIAITKPKKTLSVILTSNYRFYGNIDSEVIRHFMINTAKIITDRLVIGKTGQEYLKAVRYFNAFQAVELSKDLPTAQDLNTLSTAIKNYNQVLVFYPQLITLLTQKPVIADITELPEKNIPQGQDKKTADPYIIFEPELEKIVQFFDNQIILLLLEQTFFEAELARTASRLLAMDQAQVEANNFIKDQKTSRAHLVRTIENVKLLENISALRVLRKERTI